MQNSSQRRCVMITGASSGIGRATALRFAEAHDHLVLIGRDHEALTRVEKEIRAKDVESLICAADLCTDGAAQRVINAALDRFARLDVLVNAAGIIASGTIETTTLAAWDRMLDINLRVVFQLMQAAVPHLEKTKGNIVNVSSVTGLRSFPNVLAYCVSKAAVDQLTRCAALELAPKGIRVNAVNPGVVVTNLHRRSGFDEQKYAAFLEHSKTTHPLGRVGAPDEIAELIFFLASEKAGWITGETISIDGGRHLTCAR
ncbi:MAG: glucose 1-dehydrogenase [candidate division KSB1 bacterium]|nr:glucose 1-dehydrogenase [candidate division KSB1 bacterium]MDZ7313990.1 glucose 1-dehydrogenase [candidate division KSB1 bacterium]